MTCYIKTTVPNLGKILLAASLAIGALVAPLSTQAAPSTRKPDSQSGSTAKKPKATVAGMVPARNRTASSASATSSNKRKPATTASSTKKPTTTQSRSTAKPAKPSTARNSKPQTTSSRKPSSNANRAGRSTTAQANKPRSESRTAAKPSNTRNSSSSRSRTSQRPVIETTYAEPVQVVQVEAAPEPPRRSFISRIFGAPARIFGFGRRAQATPAADASDLVSWNVEPSAQNGYRMSGIASWYGGYWHGRKTANGERYNQNSLTAAHRTLPFNTLVKVTNKRNGKSVVVRINNRGPHVRGRVLDLSVAAARQIGSYSGGLTEVEGVVVGRATR